MIFLLCSQAQIHSEGLKLLLNLSVEGLSPATLSFQVKSVCLCGLLDKDLD